jgi:hypothetical protein
MKEISECDFEQMEKLLIEKAKAWISGPNFQSTISIDNTPFEQFEGFKARATFNGKWVFKAIVRQGYSGVTSPSLAQSLEFAKNEKAQWLAEYKRTSTNLLET